MEFTPIFWKNADARTYYVVNQGGTWAGKSYSILQLLYLLAEKKNLLVSVVSATMPHLKKGAIRDFKAILGDGWEDRRWNATDKIYKAGKGVVEFFSADQPDKVRGPRRDILFVNEANNISFSTFDQLDIRTRKRVYLDYNPVSSFWVHKEVIPKKDVTFIKSTYRDNPFLSDDIRKHIESRKGDPRFANWWRVYGEGEIGQIEGLVYPSWTMIDGFPEDCKWVCFGLDFGYTNDPTAIVRVGRKGDNIYIEEVAYQTGLSNAEIAGMIPNKKLQTIADSAEPKSIDEIARKGINIIPSQKGKDSVNSGIQQLKEFHLNVTKNSVNIQKELRNYMWQQNKDGEFINKPEDGYDHALDAVRYAVMFKLSGGGQITWFTGKK